MPFSLKLIPAGSLVFLRPTGAKAGPGAAHSVALEEGSSLLKSRLLASLCDQSRTRRQLGVNPEAEVESLPGHTEVRTSSAAMF